MSEHELVLISLGSNLEDRAMHLQRALESMDRLEGCRLDRQSSVYETTPWGNTEQPDFLNAGCGLWCSLSPEHLLSALQNIENAQGRQRDQHWGQRTLDIDIISFGTQQIDTPTLTVPHPYFSQRRFVLEPLAEIYPNHLVRGVPLSAHLDALTQTT